MYLDYLAYETVEFHYPMIQFIGTNNMYMYTTKKNLCVLFFPETLTSVRVLAGTCDYFPLWITS